MQRQKYLYLPFIVILLAIQGITFAQSEIPDLITDRPDQTESSSVVPHKSLQIETGFVMENKERASIQQRSFAYNTTLFRYALLDNLELRVGLEYLGEKEAILNTDTINTISGLSPLYTGFKVKIAEEDGWKPEVAFLGGLMLPFSAKEAFKPGYPAASLRFSFAHTLSNKLSLGYNIGAEWDGESAIPGYFYSMALGIGLTDKLGMFVEGYGLIAENGASEHLFDTGFTLLLSPNFQLDMSGGMGLNNIAIDHFISLGLTYRLLP